MRNLARLTNAANRIEAIKDWNAIAIKAYDVGRNDLVKKHKPPNNAGWRKIDKCIAALRNDLEQALASGGMEAK